MPDEFETVTIEMTPNSRIELYGQVTSQMQNLGFNPLDYDSMNLGIDLPADWPAGENAQPTIAQLAVIARKLNMRIIITDLVMVPRKKTDGG